MELELSDAEETQLLTARQLMLLGCRTEPLVLSTSSTCGSLSPSLWKGEGREDFLHVQGLLVWAL